MKMLLKIENVELTRTKNSRKCDITAMIDLLSREKIKKKRKQNIAPGEINLV